MSIQRTSRYITMVFYLAFLSTASAEILSMAEETTEVNKWTRNSSLLVDAYSSYTGILQVEKIMSNLEDDPMDLFYEFDNNKAHLKMFGIITSPRQSYNMAALLYVELSKTLLYCKKTIDFINKSRSVPVKRVWYESGDGSYLKKPDKSTSFTMEFKTLLGRLDKNTPIMYFNDPELMSLIWKYQAVRDLLASIDSCRRLMDYMNPLKDNGWRKESIDLGYKISEDTLLSVYEGILFSQSTSFLEGEKWITDDISLTSKSMSLTLICAVKLMLALGHSWNEEHHKGAEYFTDAFILLSKILDSFKDTHSTLMRFIARYLFESHKAIETKINIEELLIKNGVPKKEIDAYFNVIKQVQGKWDL